MIGKLKTTLFMALVATAAATVVCAGQPNVCPPSGCPDYGSRTFGVQMPVTRMVDVPYTVNYTRMVPVEREVSVPRGKWVTERRRVPDTRTIYVNEPYTVNETRYRTERETRTRPVRRRVRDYEARQVTETVYDDVCDPVTGRRVRVPRGVCRTVSVPVSRTIIVDESYTVNVRVPYTVPVTRSRRVARTVPTTREVCDRRWVTEMVREKVTSMEPVTGTRVETRRQPVCATEMVQTPIGAPLPSRT